MDDKEDSRSAEQAKGHLEAFLRMVTLPIPTLLVLAWAMMTGGKSIEVFTLKLPIHIASAVIAFSVTVLLLAASRSLYAVVYLLGDGTATEAVKDAIQRYPSPWSPFLLVARHRSFGAFILNNSGGFFIGFLLAALVFTDFYASNPDLKLNFWYLGDVMYWPKLLASFALLDAFFKIVKKLERKHIGWVMIGGFSIPLCLGLLAF